MRIYTEMECDIGCEDGYFCEYYNEETKSCNYPNVCNVYKENKKKKEKFYLLSFNKIHIFYFSISFKT